MKDIHHLCSIAFLVANTTRALLRVWKLSKRVQIIYIKPKKAH